MSKIYYLVPDLFTKKPFTLIQFYKSLLEGKATKYLKSCFYNVDKPVGGIKVIYQHCMLLQELGFDAYPVLMGRYKGNFFGYDVVCKKFLEVSSSIDSTDIIVSTEFAPYQGLLFDNAYKILFLQNWMGLQGRLNISDKNKSYIDIGYKEVITCSDYCSRYIKEIMDVDAQTITNGIDLNLFKPIPTKRIKGRVLAMSRKNPEDLKKIAKFLSNTEYELKVVDGLTQEKLIDEYQKADIFLATGYPEGFSLPPLEAMACGCVVVGFTGGAAGEFMLHDETALVAEDGDCETVVNMLLAIQNNSDKKEKIRTQGLFKASEYGLEITKQKLENFYKGLVNSSKNIEEK